MKPSFFKMFLSFLKIGTLLLGGGYVIVPLLMNELVEKNNWITKEDVLKVYEILKKNQYGQYLKDVLDGKYVDILR